MTGLVAHLSEPAAAAIVRISEPYDHWTVRYKEDAWRRARASLSLALQLQTTSLAARTTVLPGNVRRSPGAEFVFAIICQGAALTRSYVINFVSLNTRW